MPFRTVVWERAKALILGGFRQDEVVAILAVEFQFDEFQQEDLPALVRHQARYFGGKDDNSDRS
jgi:hypothetical protein